jgi:hypothetical protein
MMANAALMAVLAYTGTEQLLQDTADTHGFFHYTPPTIVQVSPQTAIQLYGSMSIKVFNPFFGVVFANGVPKFSNSF